MRLRPSAEAPHGRATTTLRRGFVPVGAIAVGGCGSRAEPSIRARAGGKAEKYIERRLNAVSVTSVSASRLNGARCTLREHLRLLALADSTCINEGNERFAECRPHGTKTPRFRKSGAVGRGFRSLVRLLMSRLQFRFFEVFNLLASFPDNSPTLTKEINPNCETEK